MKLLTRISLLTLALAPLSFSASIVSTVRTTYLADGGHTVSTGGPWFNAGGAWKYSGDVVLISDPNEQIYDLVINFNRNPNQAPTWMEVDTLVSNVFTGSLTQVSTDPLGQEFQTWQVNWATYYQDNVNGVFSYYFNGALYNINGYSVPVQRVTVYGTATISVISSNGQYDVASYPYTYNGLLEPIPEPSSITIFLAIASFSMFRRCRP